MAFPFAPRTASNLGHPRSPGSPVPARGGGRWAGPVALCALGALAAAPSGPARAQSPFPPAIELAGLTAGDGTNGFVLNGVGPLDRRYQSSRSAVAGAGDVNGDNIDDLIIGAPDADPNGNGGAGESYVVFGTRDGFPASLELSALDGTNGFVLNGIDEDDLSGWSVAGAGDVNGDDIDDLIIGAEGADPNGNRSGESYVVFGQSDGFDPSLELSALDGSNGFVLNGIDKKHVSGTSVAGAGDVNGDGFDDLIIGADRADPNGRYSGQSYVVFGRSAGFDPRLELSALDGDNGFVLNGIDQEDWSGTSVAGAGDVNGDGFDDLIIGALFSSETYVVFGRSAGFNPRLELSALDGDNGFVLDGSDIGNSSGTSVAGAGDFNGDGLDDLIIGAYRALPNGLSSGASYVVFGRSVGFDPRLELSALDGDNGFVLNGIDRFDASGTSVAGAGDVNGDGFDDLIIGAPLASSNGNSRAGESYVVFGRSAVSSASLELSALNGDNGFVLNGIDIGERSGNSVAGAGDVNGDGPDDLIIGAPLADPNGDFSGEYYVVFGNRGPVAEDDGFVTDESTPITADVLANNSAGPDTDPDTDPLTVTAVNGGTQAVGQAITLPSGARLTLADNGTLDYAPNGAFDRLNQGESATDSFTYTVSDGLGSDNATVTVTVTGDDVCGLAVPGSVDFGSVTIGEGPSDTARSITLDNTGTGGCVVDGVTRSGSRFFTGPTGPVAGTPIPSGQDVSIEVAFDARQAGVTEYTGTLRILSNDPNAPTQSIDLTAEGVVTATACDVAPSPNGNGTVDNDDFTAIFQAVGQSASGPNDPRDPDGDGQITTADVFYCVLQQENNP